MRLVIDASVGLKWVVPETDSDDAIRLLRAQVLLAPELILAERSNALWKKVVRRELTEDEAVVAGGVLERADLELLPMRSLLGAATRLALALAQPAYDCLYLALAAREGCGFVTADATLIRKVRQASLAGAPVIHSLAEGAALVT